MRVSLRGGLFVRQGWCVCVCVWDTLVLSFRRVGAQLWFHCLPPSIIVSSPVSLLTGFSPSPLLAYILLPTSTLASHRKRPKESLCALRKWRKCQSWPTDTHLCLVSPWEMFKGLPHSVSVTHRNPEKDRGLSVKTRPDRAIRKFWPFFIAVLESAESQLGNACQQNDSDLQRQFKIQPIKILLLILWRGLGLWRKKKKGYGKFWRRIRITEFWL